MDIEARGIAAIIVTLWNDNIAYLGISMASTSLPSWANWGMSLDMIRGFLLDEMHIFWENIFPALVKHWRGNFTTVSCTTVHSQYTLKHLVQNLSSPFIFLHRDLLHLFNFDLRSTT
jgi:hypothetical protein